MSEHVFDVVVIGAGVVGTAVARALSHHRLAVALVEAGPDVGAGTSKANTAILHTGFDAVPGSAESRLVRRGYHLLQAVGPGLGIAIEPTGALLVAWDDEQLAALPGLAAKAVKNRYDATRPVAVDELRRLEPHLGPGALGALAVPGESIVDPWTPPVAYATDAVANGCVLRRSCPVVAVDRGATGPDGITTLSTPDGPIRTRWVVNAAGLGSDIVHRGFGHESFTITPRRGELIVFDELSRRLVNHVLLPVPSKMGKGVLVSPTVFGNILLGPTADDLHGDGARTATGSTAAGIGSLLAKGRRIVPELLDEEVTAVYAGLRAATEHSDYCIELHPDQRYLCLGGIRSTGLTAALALAEEACAALSGAGLALAEKDGVVDVTLPNLGEAFPRPWQTGGRIVCHCARVTEAEIVAAARSVVPPADLDGLRRRTRVLTGRCQGFFCSAEVADLFAGSTGRALATVVDGPAIGGPT